MQVTISTLNYMKNCLKLGRGTRQENPILAYLFIVILENVFLFFKQN